MNSNDPKPGTAPRREFSYRARLVVGVCALVLLTGTVITWVAHRSARQSTEALADSLFREVSGHAVTRAQDFVLRAAPLAEALGQLAGRGLEIDDSDRLAPQLLAVLRANPGLSWVSYGDEAGTFTGAYRTSDGALRINQTRIVAGKTHLVEHDVLPDGTWRPGRRDDDSGYDPRKRPFYVKARQAGHVVWLPPYVFYNQGVPGVSCARPVHDSAGRLRGVFSIDFDLNSLSEFVADLSVGEHSKLFLFTSGGVLLAHPNKRVMESAGSRGAGELPGLADVGDPLVDDFRASLAPEMLVAGGEPEFHSFRFAHAGQDYLGSVTAFRVGDDQVWVVAAAAPRDDFLRGVARSQRWALAVAGFAMLLGVGLAALMARRVSGPVRALVGFMGRVGGGDLSAHAEFGGSREFRELSDALNRMIDDLRDRLRMRHSLDVAMEVQRRLLPAGPPRIAGLDAAGHSTCCDETGGDYYDFLALEAAGPGRLLIVMGDVMGHGVAAALVMAGARAVLRDRAAASGSICEMLYRLNRLLAADLGSDRFMTMYLAVIDVRTGEVRWASAGHDPAILYSASADRFDEATEGGLPLGVSPDIQYEEHRLGPLRPDDVLFIGTDGVWEARAPTGEAFGKERLRDAIRAGAAGTAEQIVKEVVERVTAFRGGRATDDMTFVVVKVPAAANTE